MEKSAPTDRAERDGSGSTFKELAATGAGNLGKKRQRAGALQNAERRGGEGELSDDSVWRMIHATSDGILSRIDPHIFKSFL